MALVCYIDHFYFRKLVAESDLGVSEDISGKGDFVFAYPP